MRNQMSKTGVANMEHASADAETLKVPEQNQENGWGERIRTSNRLIQSKTSIPSEGTQQTERESQESSGAAGTSPSQLGELSDDDRLAVALAARGNLRIGQFIEWALVDGASTLYVSDDELVEACERLAASL